MKHDLTELKRLHDAYYMGAYEMAHIPIEELTPIIEEARGAMAETALDVIDRAPLERLTSVQQKLLYDVLIEWVQSSSRCYDRSISILSRYSALFLNEMKTTLYSASKNGDAGTVLGLCHVFALLRIENQRKLKHCVIDVYQTSNSEIQEALRGLAERERTFVLEDGEIR